MLVGRLFSSLSENPPPLPSFRYCRVRARENQGIQCLKYIAFSPFSTHFQRYHLLFKQFVYKRCFIRKYISEFFTNYTHLFGTVRVYRGYYEGRS